MSDAKVEIDDDTFSFACPKGKNYRGRCSGLTIAGRTTLKRDPENKNGGVAQWDLSGPETAPTFAPSVNCKGCWHGYIRNGRCVSTENVDEPEPQVNHGVA